MGKRYSFTKEQEKILIFYCDDEMKELKKICRPMLVKFGGISEKDYDDFFSIALEVLADSAFRFENDKNCQFQSFLIGNIKKKFSSAIRDMNFCGKRVPTSQLDSINEMVGETGIEFGDTIQSEFDTFDTVCAKNGWKEGKIEKYLSKLSTTQKKIVFLLSEGYNATEIRKKLGLTQRQYYQNYDAIQAYENIRLLK